jgi:hypothetical protein
VGVHWEEDEETRVKVSPVKILQMKKGDLLRTLSMKIM